MKKYQDLLELCVHLSYDSLLVIDQYEISSDKMYAIQTRLTQLLILVASSFLIKKGDISEAYILKDDVLKYYPELFSFPIIISSQRITEDIDYIIASEGPEVSEVILDKASCLHIIDAIFDTDEIEYDEYLSRNHIRIQFIADNIADSINKLWHIIQYNE